MSKFSISLSNEEFESEGNRVALGSIQIEDYNENFHASLSYWDRDSYLSQWKYGLERLLRGENKSALITSIYDPDTANFIFWWVMYLIDNEVHIQNHVLFLDELDRPFNESDPYTFIPEHETKTEDGESISEWVIGRSAIESFVRGM